MPKPHRSARKVVIINSKAIAGGAGGVGGAGDSNDVAALKAEILRLQNEASENDSKQTRAFKRLSESHTRLEDEYSKLANEKAQADTDAKDAKDAAENSIDDEGYMGRVAALEVYIAILRTHHKKRMGNARKSMNIRRAMVVRDLHDGLAKTPEPFLKATNGA